MSFQVKGEGVWNSHPGLEFSFSHIFLRKDLDYFCVGKSCPFLLCNSDEILNIIISPSYMGSSAEVCVVGHEDLTANANRASSFDVHNQKYRVASSFRSSRLRGGSKYNGGGQHHPFNCRDGVPVQ